MKAVLFLALAQLADVLTTLHGGAVESNAIAAAQLAHGAWLWVAVKALTVLVALLAIRTTTGPLKEIVALAFLAVAAYAFIVAGHNLAVEGY